MWISEKKPPPYPYSIRKSLKKKVDFYHPPFQLFIYFSDHRNFWESSHSRKRFWSILYSLAVDAAPNAMRRCVSLSRCYYRACLEMQFAATPRASWNCIGQWDRRGRSLNVVGRGRRPIGKGIHRCSDGSLQRAASCNSRNASSVVIRF